MVVVAGCAAEGGRRSRAERLSCLNAGACPAEEEGKEGEKEVDDEASTTREGEDGSAGIVLRELGRQGGGGGEEQGKKRA
jgi:hypothetical protein